MDTGDVRGVITVVTLATFLGICWWAYRSDNRQRFEEDAQLPFVDDARPSRADDDPSTEGDR